MSYSRVIQVLVVEDELPAKVNYEEACEPLVGRGVMVKPRYAFCYQDAIQQLRDRTIFHLVVLDLRLPDIPGVPPQEGCDLGLAVLAECEQRDSYPIPAMIVRTGNLGKVNQGDLQNRIGAAFAYGAILAKGDFLDAELEMAINHILAYCDVGIHLHDAGQQQYPPLSPRDEDLLRRCILRQGHLGADLEWWSADHSRASGQFAQSAGWTKTLMGRFILREGMDHSRLTFFKFAPIGDKEVLERGAQILSQKWAHVKHFTSVAAGNRCLLVTQKVGSGDERPVSLEEYLRRPTDGVAETIVPIVQGLVSQIRGLGSTHPDTKPIAGMLWALRDYVASQWELWADEEARSALQGYEDPLITLEALKKNNKALRYSFQTCLHGDLNITNIALDVSPGDVHAYVFDAGWCSGGVSVRDLAMLEVTALLHQVKVKESLVRHCSRMYGDSIEPPQDLDLDSGSDSARNTLRFVYELRSQAIEGLENRGIYALMVLDNSLMQLGGLHFQVSGNKIRNPSEAALLAALIAAWIQRVAPEVLI